MLLAARRRPDGGLVRRADGRRRHRPARRAGSPRDEIFGPRAHRAARRRLRPRARARERHRLRADRRLFSRSPSHIRRATDELRAGNVYVNRAHHRRAASAASPSAATASRASARRPAAPTTCCSSSTARRVTENTSARASRRATPDGRPVSEPSSSHRERLEREGCRRADASRTDVVGARQDGYRAEAAELGRHVPERREAEAGREHPEPAVRVANSSGIQMIWKPLAVLMCTPKRSCVARNPQTPWIFTFEPTGPESGRTSISARTGTGIVVVGSVGPGSPGGNPADPGPKRSRRRPRRSRRAQRFPAAPCGDGNPAVRPSREGTREVRKVAPLVSPCDLAAPRARSDARDRRRFPERRCCRFCWAGSAGGGPGNAAEIVGNWSLDERIGQLILYEVEVDNPRYVPPPRGTGATATRRRAAQPARPLQPGRLHARGGQRGVVPRPGAGGRRSGSDARRPAVRRRQRRGRHGAGRGRADVRPGAGLDRVHEHRADPPLRAAGPRCRGAASSASTARGRHRARTPSRRTWGTSRTCATRSPWPAAPARANGGRRSRPAGTSKTSAARSCASTRTSTSRRCSASRTARRRRRCSVIGCSPTMRRPSSRTRLRSHKASTAGAGARWGRS